VETGPAKAFAMCYGSLYHYLTYVCTAPHAAGSSKNYSLLFELSLTFFSLKSHLLLKRTV
jgi:hypothetical protein